MQVIYLLPFLLVSFVVGVVCVSIRRFRRYVIPAAIAPLAFAICSIVGLAATLLLADSFGVNEAIDNNVPLAVLIYCLYGFIGAAVIVLIANRLQQWLRTRYRSVLSSNS